MRFQISLLLFFSVFMFSACGGSEEPASSPVNKSSTNVKNVNKNTDNLNSVQTSPSDPTPTPVPTVEAVTLKPLISEFCKARRDNDETALRKLYSAATLRNLLKDTRAEGKKTITEYLEVEPVGEKCSVVNERIVGNTGEATVITESYPNGIRWTFVKEGGAWKLTDQSSDFTKVKKGAK